MHKRGTHLNLKRKAAGESSQQPSLESLDSINKVDKQTENTYDKYYIGLISLI